MVSHRLLMVPPGKPGLHEAIVRDAVIRRKLHVVIAESEVETLAATKPVANEKSRPCLLRSSMACAASAEGDEGSLSKRDRGVRREEVRREDRPAFVLVSLATLRDKEARRREGD
jgi:hypothetical protein